MTEESAKKSKVVQWFFFLDRIDRFPSCCIFLRLWVFFPFRDLLLIFPSSLFMCVAFMVQVSREEVVQHPAQGAGLPC